MNITTTPGGRYEVDTTDSEALSFLVIWAGQYVDTVIASFRGNPNARYCYSVPAGEALPKLVELDSAGKFVATWVKAVTDSFYKYEEPLTV